MVNGRRRIASYSLSCLLTLSVSACRPDPINLDEEGASDSDPVVESLSTGEKYVVGEILVQFDEGVVGQAKLDLSGRVGAAGFQNIVSSAWLEGIGSAGRGDLDLLVLSSHVSMWDAIADLETDPAVKYAEPNWIYEHTATSNDPYYTNGSLWGMYGDATTPANGVGSQAGEAWAAGNTGSTAVYIGIIDEGVKWNHADLAANIWQNPAEPVDGIDNDGNGYKDDVRGWDFDKRDASTYDGSSDDHGTHVAGTIGAVGGNAKGVAGVVWNVKLITAKFLGRMGGTLANAILATDYFTDLKVRHGLNLVATNNSWGGGGFSQGLQDAIARANGQDILFIAAAGNGGSDGVGDNNDAVASYPSNYPNANVIAVAAIGSEGSKANFSNYGAATVDLGAPGVSVFSTLPTKQNGDTYGAYSGTSMATPHVTGGAALYAASHPGATAAEIKNALLGSTTPTPSLAGKCVTGGRLNVSGF